MNIPKKVQVFAKENNTLLVDVALAGAFVVGFIVLIKVTNKLEADANAAYMAAALAGGLPKS